MSSDDGFQSAPIIIAATPRLTISQINRLGRRLRHSEDVSPEDLAELQRLRAEHMEMLDIVQRTLRANIPRVSPSGRLKTWQTIVDKLKREPTMALSRMHDIAGTRMVEDMNRVEQDVLAGEVQAVLAREVGPVTTVDRRGRPSFGYRAVHVVTQMDGRYVEVQIRTKIQDDWAQIVERLGDTWGRQVRYGTAPSDDSERGRFWASVLTMADLVDRLESLVADEARQEVEPSDELATLVSEFGEHLIALRDMAERGTL